MDTGHLSLCLNLRWVIHPGEKVWLPLIYLIAIDEEVKSDVAILLVLPSSGPQKRNIIIEANEVAVRPALIGRVIGNQGMFGMILPGSDCAEN